MSCKLTITNPFIKKALGGQDSFNSIEEFQSALYTNFVLTPNALPIELSTTDKRKTGIGFLRMNLEQDNSISVKIRAPYQAQTTQLEGRKEFTGTVPKGEYTLSIPSKDSNPDLDTFTQLWLGNYLTPNQERVFDLVMRNKFTGILKDYLATLTNAKENSEKKQLETGSKVVDNFESRAFIYSLVGPNGLIKAYYDMANELFVTFQNNKDPQYNLLQSSIEENKALIDQILQLAPKEEYVLADNLNQYKVRSEQTEYEELEDYIDENPNLGAKYQAIKDFTTPSEEDDSSDIDNIPAAKALLIDLVNNDAGEFRVRIERDSPDYAQSKMKTKGKAPQPLPLEYVNVKTSTVAIVEKWENGSWTRVYLKKTNPKAGTIKAGSINKNDFGLTTSLNEAYNVTYELESQGAVEKKSSPVITLRVDSIEGQKNEKTKQAKKKEISDNIDAGKIVSATIQKTKLKGNRYQSLSQGKFSIIDIDIDSKGAQRGIAKIGDALVTRGVLPKEMQEEVKSLLEYEYDADQYDSLTEIVAYLNSLIGLGDFKNFSAKDLKNITAITNQTIEFKIEKNKDGNSRIKVISHRVKQGNTFKAINPVEFLAEENPQLLQETLDAARIHIPKEKDNTKVGKYPGRWAIKNNTITEIDWSIGDQHKFILDNTKINLTKVGDEAVNLERLIFANQFNYEDAPKVEEVKPIPAPVVVKKVKPSSEFTEGVEVDIETVVKLLSPYKGVQKVLLDIFKSRNKGSNKNFAFVPTKASNIENRVGAFSYYPSGEKLTNKDAGLSGDPNAVSPYTGVIMLSIETLEAAKTDNGEAAKLKEAFLEELVHALTAMGLETKDIQNSEEYTGLVNVINQINDLVNSGQIELTPLERKEFEYRVSLKLLDANQTTTPNLVAEFMLLPFTNAGKSLLKKAQDAGVTFSKDVSPEAENLLDAIKSLISKITEKIAEMFRNQDPSLEERITIDTLAIAMNKVRANATIPSISEALVTVPKAQQPSIFTDSRVAEIERKRQEKISQLDKSNKTFPTSEINKASRNERSVLKEVQNSDVIKQAVIDQELHNAVQNTDRFSKKDKEFLEEDKKLKQRFINLIEGKNVSEEEIDSVIEGLNKDKDIHNQYLNMPENVNTGSFIWHRHWISVYDGWLQKLNNLREIYIEFNKQLAALGETTAQTQEDVSDDFSLFGEEEAIPETPAKTSNEDPTPKTARAKPRIGASGPRKLKSMTEAFNSGFDSPEATALMFKKKNVVKSAADHADMIASTMLWEQDLFTAFSIGDVSAEDIVSAVKEELQYELDNSDSRRKNFLSYLINNIDEVWIKNSQLFKLYDVETKADDEEVSGELDDIAKDGESGAEVNKSSTENTLDGEEVSKFQERTEQRLSSLEEIGKYARLFTRMIPKIKLEKGAPVMQTVKRIVEREDAEGNIIEEEITVTEPVLYTDNLGNFKPADYTSLWNAVADAVQGCLTFDEMLQSLKSTYHKVPEMALFVSRLESIPDSREGTIIIKNIEKSLQRVYIPTKLIAEKESSRSVGMGLSKEERSKMKGTMGEAVPTFPSTRIVPIVGKNYKKTIYKGAMPKSANTIEYYIYDGGKNDSINIQNIIVSELRSTLKSLAVEGSGTIDYVKLHKLLKEKVRLNSKTNLLEKEPVIKMWEEWGLTLPANLTPDLKKAAVNSLVDFTTQLYIKLNNMESSKGAAVDSKIQSFDLFDFVRTPEFGFKGALGSVRNLLNALSKILPYATSNMTKNAEGENQSNLHNFSSFLLYIKYINQLQNATAAEKERIYKIMPRLKNPIAKYSWVLKNTKGGEKVAAVNISGTKEGNKGKLTINLDFITYMKQSFETLFGQGYKENIRAETATTSFGFTILSNKVILPIDPSEDINDKMYNIFSGYLKGEVERIYAEKTSTTKYEFKYEKSKKDFTFLKDVLSEELKNKIQGVIDSQIGAGTNLDMKEIFSIDGFEKMFKRDLIDYKKREREDFKKFVVETTGLLVTSGHPIFNTIGVRKAYDSISQRSNEDKLDTFIDYFLMNGVVLGIEEIILFHGELGQFDKFYKRSKSTISNGTPVVINNALHNVLQNTAVGVTFSEVVTGKKPEYYTTPEEMYSMVIEEDIMVPSQEQRENLLSGAIHSLTETAKEFNTKQTEAQILARANEIVDGYGFFKDEEGEAVGGATVGDGGALIHPDAYRMILWGVDSWNIEHEEGYQYLAIKYKMKKGMTISESDRETFDYVQEKIDRLGYYFQFPPVKFQYRGPGKQVMIVNGVETEVKTPVAIEMLDKFALTPAFPEAIENSLGEDLFDVMTENNIAYVKFPSATKIGSFENNKLSEIKSGYKPKGIHKLTTVFLKEQVKTPTGLKTKTLNGSQQRKLIISNIFTKDGIMDGLREFYETWVGSQRKIADQARKKLRKDLGTKIVNGKAEVDVKKLLVLLREEVDKRELPEALRDFFDRDGLNSDDAIFELSLSPRIVENMIYSLLKNRIVKEKFPGAQLIQTPSSFFSRKGVQDPMTNNRDLKFYRIDPDTGEVLPAQCKMTLHGPFLNLLNLPEVKEKGGNLEALNELLKDPTFVETHKKSLTIYSYRIPTQGYNSKDILEIVEFLPGYLGNMLVPPPQIVIKSGTDYDYDKMPTMFPNIDKNGYYIGEDSIKLEYEELSDKDAAKLKESLKLQLRNLYKANLKQVVLENKEQLKAAFERGLNPDTLNTVTDPEERKRLTSLFTQGKVYMQEALKYLNTEFLMQKELVDRLRYYRDKNVPMKVRREKYKQEFGKTLDLAQLNRDNDKAHKDLHTIINQQKLGNAYLENLKSAPYNPSAVPLINEYQEQFTKIKNELVILENSRKPQVVHHNKLIEAAKGLLLDRKNFHRLIAPNTTDYVVGALEKVLQTLYNTSGQVNPEPTNSKVFSFITHLKKWGAVKIKDLLGIAAVNNTFYALMQEARTKFNNSIFIGDNEYKDIYPLLSEEETELVDSTNPFMIGESIDKLEIINQFINLFVDAASNDIAGYTNIIRNNVGFVIYQTVLGIPFDRVLSLLHQPIIYQYNQYIEFLRSEGVDSGDIRRLAFERFFNIIPERMNKAQKIIPKSKDRLFAELSKFYPKDRISKEYLDKNISSKDKIIYENTDNDIQKSILAYYIVGLEQAEAMREVQSFVNFDTTLVQSSKMSEVRERKLNKIEESRLISVEGALKIKKESVISHLDVHEDFVELSNAVFPIKNEPNFVYNAAAIIEKAKGSDQEVLATTMENDLLLYIIQNFSNDGNFNQEKYERLKGLIDNASLMNRWTELKNKYKLEDLNLSRKLYDVTNSNGGANPAIFMGIDNDPIAFDSILYEIREMLSLPGDDARSVELRAFAQDLVELGFFQTGYNTSVLYMLKVLPPEYTEAFKGAFKAFINLDVNTKSAIYKSFFKMFLVKRANGVASSVVSDEIKRLAKLMGHNGVLVNYLEPTIPDEDNDIQKNAEYINPFPTMQDQMNEAKQLESQYKAADKNALISFFAENEIADITFTEDDGTICNF